MLLLSLLSLDCNLSESCHLCMFQMGKAPKLKIKASQPQPASSEPKTLLEQLSDRVDHLQQTRNATVLTYAFQEMDPMNIMGMYFSKNGQNRKLDVYVFKTPTCCTAEKTSSKTFLAESVHDKGHFYIDKVRLFGSLLHT